MPYLIMFLFLWLLSLGSTLTALFAENLISTTGFGLLFVGVSIVFSKILDKEIK